MTARVTGECTHLLTNWWTSIVGGMVGVHFIFGQLVGVGVHLFVQYHYFMNRASAYIIIRSL